MYLQCRKKLCCIVTVHHTIIKKIISDALLSQEHRLKHQSNREKKLPVCLFSSSFDLMVLVLLFDHNFDSCLLPHASQFHSTMVCLQQLTSKRRQKIRYGKALEVYFKSLQEDKMYNVMTLAKIEASGISPSG